MYYNEKHGQKLRKQQIIGYTMVGVIILVGGIIALISNSFPIPFSIFIIVVAAFFMLSPIIIAKTWRKNYNKGILISGEGLSVFNDHWKFDEIEFVFIDEDYHPLLGLVVVKTTKTKPMNITQKLLENPKKFWAKIPQRDKTFNNFDVKLISNLDDFVEKLKSYGVKVYWRRKGSNKIEVMNPEKQETLK